MTANQINYAKYLEDVRSHKASEDINRRQAAASERQAEVAAANAVTNRYNAEINKANSLINESAVGAQWYGAQANAAYQQAMASVSHAQQVEAARHNAAQETNQLITSGWEKTAKDYATKTQAETTRRGQDLGLQQTELQVRGNVISSLIQVGGKAAMELIGALGKSLG